MSGPDPRPGETAFYLGDPDKAPHPLLRGLLPDDDWAIEDLAEEDAQ